MSEKQMPILSLKHVTKHFGGIKAVHDVSMDVMHGERRLIIGTNGAGKSTLFNLICGDFPLTSGSVEIFGKDVTRMNVRERAKLGMRRTYQATAPEFLSGAAGQALAFVPSEYVHLLQGYRLL